MDRLYEYMQRQLQAVDSSYLRYIYPSIKWENHMLGLVGPRGVGKTTLFLQHIKKYHTLEDTLFVSADHMYFADHTLYDTAEALWKNGGRYFFIDEVHKYPAWSRELKAIYDTLPDLHVYFTGSSILDIEKGEADLSRRAPKYLMQGLSFREFLSIIYDTLPDLHVYFTGSSILDIEKGEADLSRRAPKYLMQGLSFREFLSIRHGVEMEPLDLDDILAHRYQIPGVTHPLPFFKDYLYLGYYPFSTDSDFEVELDQVISRTLEVDIPQFANMSAATGRKLKRLMAIVSTLAPFKPNMTSLASQIGASRNNLESYLMYMEKAGMIAQLRTGASGLGALGKAEKIYLDNTSILSNLSDGPENIGTVRETFFYNQMRVNHLVTASRTSDFEIEGRTFEIGGRTKGRDQLKGSAEGYVVKDDIEFGAQNVVPLWAFGLNY